MLIENTSIEGCFIITPSIYEDDRGLFVESFNKNRFENLTNISTQFVQDNQSISHKNVLRGLHFQIGAYAQAKLVRVIKGRVMDVVVDLRSNSKTFGAYFSMELSQYNHKQLYIPRGMAHGFLSLENDTIFSYKCDNYYDKASERGIIFSDKTINIDWEINHESLIVSEKDMTLPTLEAYLNGNDSSHRS